MNEPDRLETFRGMLRTCIATGMDPRNTDPYVPEFMRATVWDVVAETLDRFGGDCTKLPQCTEEEAHLLAVEFPYSATEILHGLQPGPRTALRMMRELSTGERNATE